MKIVSKFSSRTPGNATSRIARSPKSARPTWPFCSSCEHEFLGIVTWWMHHPDEFIWGGLWHRFTNILLLKTWNWRISWFRVRTCCFSLLNKYVFRIRNCGKWWGWSLSSVMGYSPPFWLTPIQYHFHQCFVWVWMYEKKRKGASRTWLWFKS